MREIKFRFWDIKFKKMLYDQFAYINSEGHVTCPYDATHQELISKDWIPLQYTGLKDKEGKEIYEGDILKGPRYCNFDLTGKHIRRVEWGETGDSDGYCYGGHQEWTVTNGTDDADSLFDVHIKSEVIGNIYENPELLNETK